VRGECALLTRVLIIGAAAAVAPVPLLAFLVILTSSQGLTRAWCFALGRGGALLDASAAREWLPCGAVAVVR
jgi:hypothetical protein